MSLLPCQQHQAMAITSFEISVARGETASSDGVHHAFPGRNPRADLDVALWLSNAGPGRTIVVLPTTRELMHAQRTCLLAGWACAHVSDPGLWAHERAAPGLEAPRTLLALAGDPWPGAEAVRRVFYMTGRPSAPKRPARSGAVAWVYTWDPSRALPMTGPELLSGFREPEILPRLIPCRLPGVRIAELFSLLRRVGRLHHHGSSSKGVMTGMGVRGAYTRHCAQLCPVCLAETADRCALPCGHSYCVPCLLRWWSVSDACSCPECRSDHSHRPASALSLTRPEYPEGQVDLGGYLAGLAGPVAVFHSRRVPACVRDYAHFPIRAPTLPPEAALASHVVALSADPEEVSALRARLRNCIRHADLRRLHFHSYIPDECLGVAAAAAPARA